MTYGVGFISGSSVYLIADTAVSSITPARSESMTSVGQSQRRVGPLTVEERANKISLVHPGIAVIIAGSVRIARNFCAVLKQAIEQGNDVEHAVRVAHASTTPRPGGFDEIEMLLACYEKGTPLLVRYNADRNGSIERVRFGQIGSLSLPYQQANETIFNALRERSERDEESLLNVAIAYLYHLTIHDDLLGMYVGGALVGLRLDYYGHYWQEPSLYVLHLGESQRDLDQGRSPL